MLHASDSTPDPITAVITCADAVHSFPSVPSKSRRYQEDEDPNESRMGKKRVVLTVPDDLRAIGRDERGRGVAASFAERHSRLVGGILLYLLPGPCPPDGEVVNRVPAGDRLSALDGLLLGKWWIGG
jgi:hypothetical protein